MSDNKYTAKISQRNVDLLASLVARLEKTKDLLFADYRGLSMMHTQQLRELLRKEGAVITVVKNRIALRALQSLKVTSGYQSVLIGPTAIIYSTGDSMAALKTLTTFKQQHDMLTVKGAIIGKTFYDAAAATAVANLPSREQLLTQLVVVAKAPIQKLVNLLHTLVSRPVTVLNEIAKSKK